MATSAVSQGAGIPAPPVAGSSTGTTSLATESDTSVRFLQGGLTGSIEADILSTDVTADDTEEVFLGTSRGLYILSQGNLLRYIPTSSSVTDIAILDDVTGDSQPDVVLVVGDTYFPNIRAYDTATGHKVWQFVPKQEVFIKNLMWTEQQTLTFDVEAVDLDSDNVKDVIASSGYRVYALDGKTGLPLWSFEATDNLWKVAVTPDLTGDGIPDVAVGGQNGYMHVLSGKDGSLLWERRLTTEYEARDERGNPSEIVDRSVWDIVPVRIQNSPKAVVSSEDGTVRLVDLKDGSIEWESQAIEYVNALLDRYYQRKRGQSTSPGDFHFFNLRAYLVEDLTGDGVEEILASAYLGRKEAGGQEPRGAGLFVLDTMTGATLWENTKLSLDHVLRMEVALLEGEAVVLLPSASIEVVALKDGVAQETIPVAGESAGRTSDVYAVKDLGDGQLFIASNQHDVLGISTSGDILWDYPRVAAVAVERGDFTGDETQDILIRSKSYSQKDGASEAKARVLYIVDGNTMEKVWAYEMPYEEFAATGGIGGIQVTPDLDRDGKQDIIGYIQEPENWDQQQHEGKSEVVAFSGRDGSVLLRQPVTAKTYYGEWDELFKDPSAFERRLRDKFETDMDTEIDRQWTQQEQDRRQEFKQRIVENWAEDERNKRNEFEQQVAREWEDAARNMRQRFEEQLQVETSALREEGQSEGEIAGFEQGRRDEFDGQLQEAQREAETAAWDGFEKQLPEDKVQTEAQWWEDFEQQLLADKENMEKEWEENFESEQLPRELENWRERLISEEQGRRIDKRIISLDVMRNPYMADGIVLVVAGVRDVYVMRPDGELLWTRTTEPWAYQDPFTGEEAPDMEIGLPVESRTYYRVPGDVNGDGIDDLVAFTGQEIVIGLSIYEDGKFDFHSGPIIELEHGIDQRQGRLVDDLDGDGAEDIAYPLHQEGQGPRGIFLSSATGQTVLEIPGHDPSQEQSDNVTLKLGDSDLDGDGSADAIEFQRWIEGSEGSRLKVLSGLSGDVVWEFSEYRESNLFENYRGPIMPAASISDFTGDGVADLALVRNLTWQPGAQVEIHDVARGGLVKEIVLEETDPEMKMDPRWHPGLVITEVGDVTGDGVKELAVVTALGEKEETKEFTLMVVDLHQGKVVADFRAFGTEFIDLKGTRGFGVVGLAGEVYLLDVENDLRLSIVGEGSASTSPVTIRWEGVGPGAFNQVFIDNVEVGRTNENEFTVAVTKGDHEVMVRSLDEYGRGIYQATEFSVEKGSNIVLLAFAATMVLLVVAFWVPISGFAGRYIGKKERYG
ncbi:PQQ-binding-like beta-propeller repeat protein [Chloroflexota bacterium]